MTASLQLVANDIRLEGNEIDARLSAEWLDRELAASGVRGQRGADEGARVVGRVSRSDDDIVVRCRVAAAVEAECVRCLEPARFVVKADVSLLLQLAPKAAGGKAGLSGSSRGASHRGRGSEESEEYEFGADEAEVDTYDGETVVLDGFVREAILLEMPNFPLCSEACPGIRPTPEHHELLEEPAPVDPRLAPLGAFKKQLGGATTLDELVAAAAERSAAMGRPVMRSNAHPTKKKKK
jgi:uncharacterized protein